MLRRFQTRLRTRTRGSPRLPAKELLAAIVESSEDAIVSRDMDGIVSTWNPAAERLFGYTGDEILGKPIFPLIPEDRLAEETEMMARLMDGHHIEYYETIRLRKNGTPVHVSVSASPVKNRDGRIVGAAKIIRDLTRQRQTDAELRKNAVALERSESQYRTLFESIDEGFCVIEVLFDSQDNPVDYRFLEVNPAFTKHTGLNQPIGKTVRELAPAHESHWFEIYGKVVSTGEPIRFEGQAYSLNRWFDVYAFRIGLPEERKVAVLFNDITNRKHTELKLRAAQQKLADTNKNLETLVRERTAKLEETISDLESFSYTVSHDLRSPLRAMQGFAHMILEEHGTKLDETARDYLNRIGKAAQRMDLLIQDVIAYDKAADVGLTNERVDLEKIVDEIIQLYPSVNMPHASFEVRRPLHHVVTSSSALLQALSNLLINAVKFVGAGQKVVVRVWTELLGSRVRLFVQDNGIGIEPEMFPKIFEAFQSAHPRKGYEGSGIGLAIAKKAIERAGGKIGVESEVGKGSTFWIELPAAE